MVVQTAERSVSPKVGSKAVPMVPQRVDSLVVRLVAPSVAWKGQWTVEMMAESSAG
jgi:hypothetical protein